MVIAMKMRDLERRTGVNREVIRIMFRAGLLPDPLRVARNTAEYDEVHVRAIGVVRELQQSSRLTLSEIREALEGRQFDSAQGRATTYHHLDELLSLHFGIGGPSAISLSAICERSPRALHDAQAFAALGMLEIVETEEGQQLSLTDARLVDIWTQIRAAGFVEEVGFLPENIAFYRRAADYLAAREARIFFRQAKEHFGEAETMAALERGLPLMLEFFGLLRIKAFIRRAAAVSRSTENDDGISEM